MTIPWQIKEMRIVLPAFIGIPDSYDAKIAKIRNFWTFWPVIQLIKRSYFSLFTSKEHWAKGFLSDFEKMVYQLNTGQDVQKLRIFAIFASSLSGILNRKLRAEDFCCFS